MSKIIVADSGSTKTDWRLIDLTNQEINQYSCKGLNPYHNTEQQLRDEIEATFQSIDLKEIKQVFFYGAGCSSDSKKLILKNTLYSIFTQSKVEVNHDLLAAARATLNKEKGIVMILGTGSSCGLYDGNQLKMPVPSLGYILGDEGSGVAIGKRVLKDYLYGKFPAEMSASFSKRYLLNKEEVLDQIYSGELPNKFIASFSPFALHNKQKPYMANLLKQVFTELFEEVISTIPGYKMYPLSIVGSVGFYYSDFIRSVANDFGLQVGTILEKPIAGLTIYHTDLKE